MLGGIPGKLGDIFKPFLKGSSNLLPKHRGEALQGFQQLSILPNQGRGVWGLSPPSSQLLFTWGGALVPPEFLPVGDRSRTWLPLAA